MNELVERVRAWLTWLGLSVGFGLAVFAAYHVICLDILVAYLLWGPVLLLGLVFGLLGLPFDLPFDFGWPVLFLYPSLLCAVVLLPILFRRPDKVRTTACFVAVPLVLFHLVCAVVLVILIHQRLIQTD